MPESHRERETLRFQRPFGWIWTAKPERRIDRVDEPTILNIEQAKAWITREKPLIWLGSLFSVPEPSGFPSGIALTKSILELILFKGIPEEKRKEIIDTILPLWPLEALLDEFELLHFDLSESLLTFFKGVNETASPNPLHDAVTSYYQTGLSGRPLCITSNWDTIQEKSFRLAGYKVVICSIGEMASLELDKMKDSPKTVIVYHPHGSFETKDIVCSSIHQQGQLPFDVGLLQHSLLFLGYSGYEPSLYRDLESNHSSQLWCIRDRTELEVPAKRRLLSRSNTYVYIGDVQDLLQSLNLLKDRVDLTSKYVQPTFEIPEKVIEIVQLAILASLDPGFCSDILVQNLISFFDQPEDNLRYVVLMKALIKHIRNRIGHPGILPALISASRFRDSEQIWISVLAYLLRLDINLKPNIIRQILKYSDEASKKIEEPVSLKQILFGKTNKETAEPNAKEIEDPTSLDDIFVYSPAVLLNRSEIYKEYVGEKKRKKGKRVNNRLFYIMTPVWGGDMAASGEFIEILAFKYLREGKKELAQNCFDYASTSFYLSSLWNSGKLNEWASKNIERLAEICKNNTLVIPVDKI